jgi:hypothetical protein
MRAQFNTRTVLAFVSVIAVVLVIAIVALSNASRSRRLAVHDRWTGRYTGMGLADTNDILGFRYYEFVIDDLPYRTWIVSYQRREFNEVTAYFPDGSVCLVGTCRVEGTGREMYPLIDALGSATTYRPDGSIAGTVQDGHGEVYLHYPNGPVQWKMEYEDHERISWSLWNEDGTLNSSSER